MKLYLWLLVLLLMTFCRTQTNSSSDSIGVQKTEGTNSHKIDSIALVFKILQSYNYEVDTSFLLRDKTYLSTIDIATVQGAKMDRKACECVDTVRLFKIFKRGFEPQKNDDYFSYAGKDFDSRTYLEIWYFKDAERAKNCLVKNKLAFEQDELNIFPVATYQFSNILMTVEPANQKENDRYREVLGIVDSISSLKSR